MIESATGKERPAYVPVFAPLLTDYKSSIRKTDLTSEETDSFAHRFYELPNPVWKRALMRHMLSDIAVDYTIVARPNETGRMIAHLIPDTDKQLRAYNLFEAIAQAGEVPMPRSYDTYLYLGAWNRAQLTARDRDQTTHFFRQIYPYFVGDLADDRVRDVIGAETDNATYELFSMSKIDSNDPEQSTYLNGIQTITEGSDEGKLSVDVHKSRIAALASDYETRRQFSTGKDGSLNNTNRTFKEFLAPYSGASAYNRLMLTNAELYELAEYGYNLAKLGTELNEPFDYVERQMSLSPFQEKYKMLQQSRREEIIAGRRPRVELIESNEAPPVTEYNLGAIRSATEEMRNGGRHISVKSREEALHPVLQRAHTIAEDLRKRYSSWVEKHIAHLKDLDEEVIQSHFIRGLSNAVTLNYRTKQRQSEQNGIPFIYTDRDVQESVIGYTLDFFAMLRNCNKREISPKTSLKLAERTYRISPDILDEYENRFPHIPINIISFALSKGMSTVEDYLHDLNSKVAYIRSMPQYTHLSTARIASAINGRAEDAYLKILDRSKTVRAKPYRRRAITAKPPPVQPEPPRQKLTVIFPQREEALKTPTPVYKPIAPAIGEYLQKEGYDGIIDMLENLPSDLRLREEELSLITLVLSHIKDGIEERHSIDRVAEGDVQMASKIRTSLRKANRFVQNYFKNL